MSGHDHAWIVIDRGAGGMYQEQMNQAPGTVNSAAIPAWSVLPVTEYRAQSLPGRSSRQKTIGMPDSGGRFKPR